MTTVWVVVGVFAAVGGAAFGVVAWRDRARLRSVDDDAAGRDARARQHRYEAERHGEQGDLWQRGRDSTG
ncbi:hypothetical protein GA0070607_5942 [Micromonospora coriariae]|uniref:Uncharacterized protein n=1 Tax=Micromonospora coriariae TaxID=285665 RepID=A0A1C4XY53_9ACTN|nr:hypothetical protein [Micromonospora coriariae]SCF13404.1 hypothetical protein GA0070607_5942 [Micromonospora coriariae]